MLGFAISFLGGEEASLYGILYKKYCISKVVAAVISVFVRFEFQIA